MRVIPTIDNADGYTRAEAGELANAGELVVKTASYTLTAFDSGKIFSNRGAAGAVTFTLPTPKAGQRYIFIRPTQTQNVVVTRSGSAAILDGVTPFTGTTATASTANERASVEVFSDGTDWFLRGKSGTWTIS